MTRNISLFLVAAAIFVMAFAAGLPPNPPSAAAQAGAASIDPRVLADTEGGRTGRFLVVLRNQANPRAAALPARSWDTRGRLVVQALQQAAAASQPAVRAHLDKLGAHYRAYWIVNLIAVQGTRTVVDAMAARPDVSALVSDRPFPVPLEQPTGPAPAAPAGIQPNLTVVNAPALWALGFHGEGRVLANADTGVMWTHPALQPHYRGWNRSTANHNYNWWDAVHAGSSTGNPCGYDLQAPCDDVGHGTHTMGIAVGDDGAGNQIGMAPGAKWIACRNMDSGLGSVSRYVECLQFFLAPTDLSGQNADPSRRPDAVGNSYGCTPNEVGCTSAQANQLLAAVDAMRAAGIFMAVSAGNSGPNCATIVDPPAIYDSSITVGGTNNSDGVAFFTSRGPVTVDGSNRRKPDLAAPAMGIYSSYVINTSIPTYTIMSGTSMAAPHVSGAVALLWQANPTLRGNVDFTELTLEQSARHLTTTQDCGNTAGAVPNDTFGYGRIDVLAAHSLVPARLMPAIFKVALP